MYETLVIEQVIACVQSLDEGKEVTMCDAIIVLQSEFTAFKTEVRRKSQLFAFWSDYVCMVQLLIQFIKSEKTGHWLLQHLFATAATLRHRSFSQWIDISIPGGFCFFLADMDQLSETHPAVHEEFISENHSISRSTQPFAQVWTDMANLDSKTTGGIKCISQRPGALEHLVPDVPRTSNNYNSHSLLLYSYVRNKQYYYEEHVCFTRLRLSCYTQRGSTETDVER